MLFGEGHPFRLVDQASVSWKACFDFRDVTPYCAFDCGSSSESPSPLLLAVKEVLFIGYSSLALSFRASPCEHEILCMCFMMMHRALWRSVPIPNVIEIATDFFRR
jgi:hypothetical protein